MKKVFYLAVFVMTVLSAASCDLLSSLGNNEEFLSLTAEESDELIQGKWILNKVGYTLELDGLNDVEQVVTDDPGYPAIESTIEYMTIKGKVISFNFKESTMYERYFETDGGRIGSEYVWCESLVADPDVCRMKLGFDGEGTECINVYENLKGGLSRYGMSLYGVEKGDDYKVNRMILHVGIDNDTYYEFIPAKE